MNVQLLYTFFTSDCFWNFFALWAFFCLQVFSLLALVCWDFFSPAGLLLALVCCDFSCTIGRARLGVIEQFDRTDSNGSPSNGWLSGQTDSNGSPSNGWLNGWLSGRGGPSNGWLFHLNLNFWCPKNTFPKKLNFCCPIYLSCYASIQACIRGAIMLQHPYLVIFLR